MMKKRTFKVQNWVSPKSVVPQLGFSPLKSLGQNFLIEKPLLEYISEQANVEENDAIVEIGPGTGALTQHLIPYEVPTLCLELDKGLAAYLKQTYESPQLSILHGDVLAGKHDLHPELISYFMEQKKAGRGLKLISNLPYNILTPLLINLLKYLDLWHSGLFLVQKEFADRLMAKEGTKAYSLLSVIGTLFLKMERLKKVGRNCFWPAPSVESLIIRVSPTSNTPPKEEFILFLKALFIHRRKSLAKVLKQIAPQFQLDLFIEEHGLSSGLRAESLPPHLMLQLFNDIQKSSVST
ncbi:MAG: ribosomal RNA small subunit methyltransferase A [Planctomycetes bacterium]|nr:ribosomal RNA small subunit methyltransferase A [Planctomycetota bacterium]